MDKGAIKSFAIAAREMLRKSAMTEAGFYGITKDEIKSPIQKGNDFEVYKTIAGTENRIYGNDIKRRANLVNAINTLGFEQVIEETAYTWFNRLIAIRFMEVNDYLPTRVRVLSSETGSNTPDIVSQSLDVDLNMTPEEVEKVQIAKEENRYDEAFRLLFIKQCNELNTILPGLFEKTDDYMELLLKLTYTNDGVVRMLVDNIPEDNFNVDTEGQVEIIGWLYQYYNTELKDDTFAKLKKNIKISKERIPAATQLFTPDWIVRYMVENSVGRVWIEHLRANMPGLDEKAKAEEFGWKYYLPEAEQETDVEAKLVEVRNTYKDLTPSEITCIDPCMGSGHILVYMFDVLMDIYRSEGFNERDAVFSILENNIRGLDIDRRAYQLSYFALMMKARQYNRRFFRGIETEEGERKVVEPHVFAIEESNDINREQLKYFGATLNELEKNNAINQMTGLLNTLIDAKEYGSILKVEQYNWELLRIFVREVSTDGQISFDTLGIDETKKKLKKLIEIGSVMAHKYHVVSTNPPYMAISSGTQKLVKYVNKHYIGGKTDLFAVFIERCGSMCIKNMFFSMITMQSWMFLTSFKKLREKLLKNNIVNMIHLGSRAFDEISGEVVQTVSYVLRKTDVLEMYAGKYSRLVEGINEREKENLFLQGKNVYINNNHNYFSVPQYLIAYWVSQRVIDCFEHPTLESVFTTREGMATADNERFLRLWFEPSFEKITLDCRSEEDGIKKQIKWVPYNKGGATRDWYGNNDYVVNWSNNGHEIKNNKDPQTGRVRSHNYNGSYAFREGLTWSAISSGDLSVRYCKEGFLFDSKGAKGFTDNKEDLYWILGLLNSKVAMQFLQFISPTLDFKVGDIISIPYIVNDENKEKIVNLVKRAVSISCTEWNEKETTWDFSTHPLVVKENVKYRKIKDVVYKWLDRQSNNIDELRLIEMQLNSLFADIYGLNDDIETCIENEEVTLNRVTEREGIINLISYAVGCMVGRYSLDVEGIIYAGGEWDASKYKTFIPDADGIIPITDEEYFDDDIMSRLVEFIKVVYGEDTLEENLDFIAKALGNKGDTSRRVIRNYFINDFYKDHCNMYSVTGSGKRPIYWLFDSGKQNGFKALIYMHRYNRDTVGVIRSDYLHKVQDALENALKNAEYIINTSSSAVDKAKATKARDKYIKQLNETRTYYQALSHVALQRIEIDLDDGVKHNYALFQGVEVSNEGMKKQTIDLLAKLK